MRRAPSVMATLTVVAGAGGFIAQAFGPYDHETFERLAGEVWPAIE